MSGDQPRAGNTVIRQDPEVFLTRRGRRHRARRIAVTSLRHRQWVAAWDWLVYSLTLRETKRARRWAADR